MSVSIRQANILNISAGTLGDGAVGGALNFHRALLKAGFNSKFVLQATGGNKPSDIGVLCPFWKISGLLLRTKYLVTRIVAFYYGSKLKVIFSPCLLGGSFKRIIRKTGSNTVIVHWNGYEYINLKKILENPNVEQVIFIARDYWIFTGGCHMPSGCSEHQRGCFYCPLLKGRSDIPGRTFLTSYLYDQKKYLLRHPKFFLALLTPTMLAGFENSRFSNIPVAIGNVIDIPSEDFVKAGLIPSRPLENQRPILLLHNDTGEPWKNYGVNAQIASDRRISEKYDVITFGNGRGYDGAVNMGKLLSRTSLFSLLARATILVFPSQDEPFGKLVYEALYCGVHVLVPDSLWAGNLKAFNTLVHRCKDGNYVDFLLGANLRAKASGVQAIRRRVDYHNSRVMDGVIELLKRGR